MYQKYSEVKNLVNIKIIKDILTISKNIGLHQKSVQYSTFCYMKYVQENNKVKDHSLLVTSSIFLGNKIANYVLKFETIIENVLITYDLNFDEQELKEFKDKVIRLELDMTVSLDFDFNIQDQYDKIMNYSNELKNEMDTDKHKLIIQSLWIFINDSLFYPFDQEVIFKSCLYLSNKIHNKPNKVEQILNDKSKNEILFVADEIIDGYTSYLND
jgi:hypothetical protein